MMCSVFAATAAPASESPGPSTPITCELNASTSVERINKIAAESPANVQHKVLPLAVIPCASTTRGNNTNNAKERKIPATVSGTT